LNVQLLATKLNNCAVDWFLSPSFKAKRERARERISEKQLFFHHARALCNSHDMFEIATEHWVLVRSWKQFAIYCFKKFNPLMTAGAFQWTLQCTRVLAEYAAGKLRQSIHS
jgi:hypothetical protein